MRAIRDGLPALGSRILASCAQRRLYGPPAAALWLVALIGPPPDQHVRAPAHWQPRPPPCTPVSDRDLIPSQSVIDTGQYTLTLVATNGPSAGASARGGLWLAVLTGGGDTTRHTAGSRPAPLKPGVPLYGTTNVDLAGVGAPLPHGDTATAPKPYSFDPRRPGVIARFRIDTTNAAAIWRFYIATVDNDQMRCHPGTLCWAGAPTTGPGVVLDVHKIDNNGFAGSWRPVAPDDVHGYFCASPVRYYSRFKTRSLPQPPATH